jgi:hypothetical protein
MTFALPVSVRPGDGTLRKSPGATFQCWPLSVMDRNGFLVVPSDYPKQRRPTFRLKRDPVADPKVEHLRMRAHLVQKPQPRHDPVVKIDQFFLGEFVDVNLHDSFRLSMNIHPRVATLTLSAN